MPTINLEPVTAQTLRQHAVVPIAFTVTSVFDVELVDRGLGGWRLSERPVEPYVKDYDALEPPTRFTDRWDTGAWGLLAAVEDGRRVGGAVLAVHTAGLHMLEGRDDLAVLMDLRVAPAVRGRGLGGQLLSAACAWASEHRCRQLKIETQNVNVPACRFYAGHGCELRGVHPHAYPDMPHEVQLLWYRDLYPPKGRVAARPSRRLRS